MATTDDEIRQKICQSFIALSQEAKESGLSMWKLLKQRESSESTQTSSVSSGESSESSQTSSASSVVPSSSTRKSSASSTSTYRFDVGTKVLCRIGVEKWAAGEIILLNYTEAGWARAVPYQVRLDDGIGTLIFVPADIEQICQEIVPPWWSNIFAGKPEGFFLDDPPADVIRKELERTQESVNAGDHEGQVALMAAVQCNWRAGVSEILGLNADVNAVTKTNKHALHFAARCGEDMTKILIDAKADLNTQEDDPDLDPEYKSVTFGDRKQHRSPLQVAVLAGQAATATLLISQRAQIDLRDAQFKTALHLAIEEKNTEMIDLLLQQKADVNLGNTEFGMNSSPLMEAAYWQDLPLVRKLVEAKAAVNQQGKQSMSALHFAARGGDAEIVKFLVEANADISQTSKCGTVEQLARKNGGSALLKVLGFAEKVGCAQSQNLKLMDAAQCAAVLVG